jgi:undecaprenyl-diphosphatase
VLAHLAASDVRIWCRLRTWSPPPWFRAWMVSSHRLGEGWIYAIVALGLAAMGPAGTRVLAGASVAAGFANVALVLLKAAVQRPRPCDLAFDGAPPFAEKPRLYFPSDLYSFPSGHALNAFAVGTVLALSFPSLSALVAVAALSMAASRVALGHHYLSDAVAGALIGSFCGAFAFLAWLR